MSEMLRLVVAPMRRTRSASRSIAAKFASGGLLLEEQVTIAELRTGYVSVEVLRLRAEDECIGNERVNGLSDGPNLLGFEIRRGRERSGHRKRGDAPPCAVGSCSLLRERVLDDPARLRASVRALLELDFDTLLAGDGESILSGAKGKLRDLVQTFA